MRRLRKLRRKFRKRRRFKNKKRRIKRELKKDLIKEKIYIKPKKPRRTLKFRRRFNFFKKLIRKHDKISLTKIDRMISLKNKKIRASVKKRKSFPFIENGKLNVSQLISLAHKKIFKLPYAKNWKDINKQFFAYIPPTDTETLNYLWSYRSEIYPIIPKDFRKRLTKYHSTLLYYRNRFILRRFVRRKMSITNTKNKPKILLSRFAKAEKSIAKIFGKSKGKSKVTVKKAEKFSKKRKRRSRKYLRYNPKLRAMLQKRKEAIRKGVHLSDKNPPELLKKRKRLKKPKIGKKTRRIKYLARFFVKNPVKLKEIMKVKS